MKHILIFIFSLLSINCFPQNKIESLITNSIPGSILRYYYEGNFTNSGKIEVIAFYQRKRSLSLEGINKGSVQDVYCYLFNENLTRIDRSIKVPFNSPDLSERYQNFLKAMDLAKLGFEVPFGRIGDFNGNGVDELYFYQLIGSGFYPLFIEYNGDYFEQILQFKTTSSMLNLVNVNKDRKELTLIGENDSMVYKWDSLSHKYELKPAGETDSK